jgi:ATP-binding cassette subfamily C protein
MRSPVQNTDAQSLSLLGEVFKNGGPALSLAILFTIVLTFLMFVPPLYMISVFDKVLYSGSSHTLIGISIAALIGIVCYIFFDYFRSKLFLKIGYWLGARLYEGVLQPALTRSVRTGGGATEVIRDVSEVRQFLSGPTIASGLELLVSPILYAVLFLLHPMFFLVTAGFGVLLVAIGLLNQLLLRGPTAAAKSAAMTAYTDLGDALRNGEAIEGMGLMQNVVRRWEVSNQETLDFAAKAESRANAVKSISRGIRFCQIMVVIGTGAVLTINGECSRGVMFAAMIISGRAVGPIDAVVNSWRQWIGVGEAAKRLRQLMAEDGEGSVQRSTMALPRPTGNIHIDRLVFAPAGIRIPTIRNLSLNINAGEFIVIAGSSGAGKSTLAKLIVGIWPPSAGNVRFDGHDAYTWERADFGQYVGYLPQQVELFSGTVRENIARLGTGPAPKVIEAAKRAGVHEMVGRFAHGYDTDVGTFGQRLTGGQRQRIGIARALYGNPAVIVLDEPDASLDAEGQAALHNTLLNAKTDGVTVIVVSHRAGLLKLADRIVVMREGTIDRIVAPQELLFDDRGLVGFRETRKALAANAAQAQA